MEILYETWFKSFAKFRSIIKSNRIIIKYFLLLRGKKSFLVNSNTALCIEGFPRSANSFIHQSLKILLPDVKTGHHTHCIANIKIAFKKKVPVYILIRNPIEALSSFILRMIWIKKRGSFIKYSYYGITDYKYFYKFVLDNLDKVEIICFNEIIKNPKQILEKIVKKLNLNLDVFKNTNISDFEDKALSNITKADFRVSSKPDKRKSIYKNKIKFYLNDNHKNSLKELDKIYELVTSKTYSKDI